MTTKATKYEMLPYYRQGKIDYDSLDFDPHVPEPPPDSMEQNREMDEIMGLLRAHVTDFDSRPDIFLEREINICYDRRDLNVRVAPDVSLVFGVESDAIRERALYLP